jgi:splicing factor 3A subunit 1
VDKTATFVARNGVEFEARIRRNEMNNPKFNFLNVGDPYHAYYQYKVKEIKEGKTAETTPAAPAPAIKTPSAAAPPPSVSTAQHQKQQEILKQFQQEIPQIPKEPPPDFEFIVDPPSISAMEL